MKKLVTLLVCSAYILMPIAASAASGPTGEDLQNTAAARRVARMSATETPTKNPTDKASTLRRPRSTAPLHTPETRENARKAARMKLQILREAEGKNVTDTKIDIASMSDLKDEILTLTNAERKKEGIPPLKRNARLDLSAQAHVLDMQSRNFFSHTNPDGLEPTDRIKKTGYLDITVENCDCSGWKYAVGENIAKGQQTPTEAIRDWMASPTHRSAILSPEYLEIGIGIIDDLWAQNFGSIKIRK